MSFGIEFSGSATIDGKPLFAPLTLSLPKGRWTCLLGGSGVGKSTILRLIAGLPTEAVFDGHVASEATETVREHIAFMAQDDLLLPWASVLQNIGLGAKLRGEKPDLSRQTHLLELVGLAEHAEKKPSELSGGQRQRAALARTLMEDKPVVLLDEPFSALDAQTRHAMQDLAFEIFEGKTVLMVTHDPSEAARVGDQIAILTAGGLALFPSPGVPTPRPTEDMGTLKCQSELLALLRSGGAGK